VAHWRLDGGASVDGQITIPVSDNGVKMVHAEAAPLREEEIQGLLAPSAPATSSADRASARSGALVEDYFTAITERVMLARKLRVVVDAGRRRGHLRPRAAAPAGL